MEKGMGWQHSSEPFTEEYYNEELAAVPFPKEPMTIGDLRYELHSGWRVLECFFYRDFREYTDVPVLLESGEPWMSITPLEVESHYMPILMSSGRVGTAGLGLGYYVQRILGLERVREVVVYEANADIVDIYMRNFGPHPKLTIVNQDVLTVAGEAFDFFYMDIYAEDYDLAAIGHMEKMLTNNDIGWYHWWTMERALLDMCEEGYEDRFSANWRDLYFAFLRKVFKQLHGRVSSTNAGKDVARLFEAHHIFELQP